MNGQIIAFHQSVHSDTSGQQHICGKWGMLNGELDVLIENSSNYKWRMTLKISDSSRLTRGLADIDE